MLIVIALAPKASAVNSIANHPQRAATAPVNPFPPPPSVADPAIEDAAGDVRVVLTMDTSGSMADDAYTIAHEFAHASMHPEIGRRRGAIVQNPYVANLLLSIDCIGKNTVGIPECQPDSVEFVSSGVEANRNTKSISAIAKCSVSGIKTAGNSENRKESREIPPVGA